MANQGNQPFDNCNNLYRYDVTIASGASVSEMICTEGSALVGLLMPAAWTAASIQFQAALAGEDTPVNVTDNGGNYEQAIVSTSKWVAFPSPDAIFTPFLRLLSVAEPSGGVPSVTPAAQGAARTISLIFRRYLS